MNDPYSPQGPHEDWERSSGNIRFVLEDVVRRVDQLEQQVANLQLVGPQRKTGLNLTVRIFLYSAGTLLVFMALVLLLQYFGILQDNAEPVIWALVLLAIGLGILTGIRNRYP